MLNEPSIEQVLSKYLFSEQMNEQMNTGSIIDHPCFHD